MSSLRKIVALFLVMLCLAACSDDDSSSGEVVLRIDENGEEFSPTKLEGSVEYLPSMKPEAVRVVRLDNKLYPVDSFELSIESNYMDKYSFRDGLRDYETPYIKVVTVFSSEKKNEKLLYGSGRGGEGRGGGGRPIKKKKKIFGPGLFFEIQE